MLAEQKIFWQTSHGVDGDFLGREDLSEEAWVARRWPALPYVGILWYDRQTLLNENENRMRIEVQSEFLKVKLSI